MKKFKWTTKLAISGLLSPIPLLWGIIENFHSQYCTLTYSAAVVYGIMWAIGSFVSFMVSTEKGFITDEYSMSFKKLSRTKDTLEYQNITLRLENEKLSQALLDKHE